MMIRLAEQKDLTEIVAIYDFAREFMRKSGNETQWGSSHPSVGVLNKDIEQNHLYVNEDQEGIHAVFALILEDDPTYQHIDGAWLDDEVYAAIHRIASKGSQKGMFNACVDFAWSICPNLRIDTHMNNGPMRHLIEKSGFVYCGIVVVEDGSPRLAYQKIE